MANLERNIHLIPRDRDGKRLSNPVFSKLKGSFHDRKSGEVETYRGEVPSIIGLILMLVKVKHAEAYVFARKNNAVRISKKYGTAFKRFLGEVSNDPRPFQTKNASFNRWEAIENSNEDIEILEETEDDLIVADAFRRRVRVDLPEVIETEYNPYEEKSSEMALGDEDTDQENVETIADTRKAAQEDFNRSVNGILETHCSEELRIVWARWRKGYTRSEITEELGCTDKQLDNMRQKLFVRLRKTYQSPSLQAFNNSITETGILYRTHIISVERTRILETGMVSPDSTLFNTLKPKEGIILGLIRGGLTDSGISVQMKCTVESIWQYKKRLAEKLSEKVFSEVVNGRIRFEEGCFPSISATTPKKYKMESETVDFRSGITYQNENSISDPDNDDFDFRSGLEKPRPYLVASEDIDSEVAPLPPPKQEEEDFELPAWALVESAESEINLKKQTCRHSSMPVHRDDSTAVSKLLDQIKFDTYDDSEDEVDEPNYQLPTETMKPEIEPSERIENTYFRPEVFKQASPVTIAKAQMIDPLHSFKDFIQAYGSNRDG
jgi:DNA-binding CsgD family transcriptional regulator